MSDERDDDQGEVEEGDARQVESEVIERLRQTLGTSSASRVLSVIRSQMVPLIARQENLRSIAATSYASVLSESWLRHLQCMMDQSARALHAAFRPSLDLSATMAAAQRSSLQMSGAMAQILSWSARLDAQGLAAARQSLAVADAARASLMMGPAIRASLAQLDIPRIGLLHEIALRPPTVFEQTANQYRIEQEEAEGDELAVVRASAGMVASSSTTNIVCASNLEVLTLYDPERGISGSSLETLPTYNILQVQRAEIQQRIAERGIPIDAEELLANLPYERELTLGLEVNALILDCDRASRFAGKDPIFGSSSKFIAIIAVLPGLVATNEVILGELVDHLYFLLWECAEKKKGLFWSLLGGEDKNFINEVRLLRNNFYRHDVEHDEHAEEKIEKLGQFFGEHIGKRMPRMADDYRNLQRYLLGRLIALLAHVCEQLT